jgi:hypothetical protein
VYRSWTAGNGPPPPKPLDRPVWVDLEALYGPDGGSIEDPAPGWLLNPTGKVPGTLRWWKRSLDGRWFGVVNFAVTDAYGAIMAQQDGVLVPAFALSPANETGPRAAGRPGAHRATNRQAPDEEDEPLGSPADDYGPGSERQTGGGQRGPGTAPRPRA